MTSTATTSASVTAPPNTSITGDNNAETDKRLISVSGKEASYQISGETVGDVRQKIANDMNVLVAQVQLFRCGKRLLDDDTKISDLKTTLDTTWMYRIDK
jgi:hypothetical protein